MLRPTIFDARQLPCSDCSDIVVDILARSPVAVGVCANATVASKAEAAKPAVICFNMCFLPDMKWSGENTPRGRPFRSPDAFSPHGDEHIRRVPRNIIATARAALGSQRCRVASFQV